jgi:hypothetical protein
MTLYRNGTISYTKRYILDLRCSFDYSSLPKDKHYCKFIFFPLTYDRDVIKMTLGNVQNDVDGILLTKSVSAIRLVLA